MRLYLTPTSTSRFFPDLFGCVKWPFQGLSDLHLGDQKVTGKKLDYMPSLVQNSRCVKFWGNMSYAFSRRSWLAKGTWNLDGWNWVRNSSESRFNQVFLAQSWPHQLPLPDNIGWMKPCQEIVVVNMPLLSLTTPCLPCSHLITEPEAIMKSMDHPNIIKLFETFEDRKHIYLVAWQSNDITSNQNVMRWWCRVTWG